MVAGRHPGNARTRAAGTAIGRRAAGEEEAGHRLHRLHRHPRRGRRKEYAGDAVRYRCRALHRESARLSASPAPQPGPAEAALRQVADPGRLGVPRRASGAQRRRRLRRHGTGHRKRTGLGRFIRSLVGLDQQAVQEAFAEFLGERTASSSQIDFVNLVISHLTRHGEMDPKLLFEAPFTDTAPQGPTQLFAPEQTKRLVGVIRSISNSAGAATA